MQCLFCNTIWKNPNSLYHSKEVIEKKRKSYIKHIEQYKGIYRQNIGKNEKIILDNIENQIKSNKDFIGRDFNFRIDETNLPEFILKNKERYAHLWKS